MRILTHILFVITFIVAAIDCYAEYREVKIRPTSGDVFEVDPNSTVSLIFQITNSGNIDTEFMTEFELPDKWRLLTPNFPFSLPENGSDIRINSVMIPRSAQAGQYELMVRVQARGYPEISDYYPVMVTVLPVRDLDIHVLETAQFIIAGDSYQQTYSITNHSNMKDSILIKVQPVNGFEISLNKKECCLEPGESDEVIVNIQSDPELTQMTKHGLRVTAISATLDSVRASELTLVDVIPRTTGKHDRFERYPLMIKATPFYQKNNNNSNSGIQFDLYGSGALDDSGHHHIKFHVRAPDQYLPSSFTRREKYAFSYTHPIFEIHAGDQNFSLSSLTEKHMFGRGYSMKLKLDTWTFGGNFHQAIWTNRQDKRQSAFISYQKNSVHQWKVNLHHRENKNQKGNVYSTEYLLNPSEKLKANIELALGENRTKSKWLNASEARISGQFRKFFYHTRWIHADSDFPGHYYNTDSYTTALSWSLGKWLILSSNLLHEKQNVDFDTAYYSAPFSQNIRSGVKIRLPYRINISMNALNRTREDQMPEPKFHYRETGGRFGVQYTGNKLFLESSWETGDTKNFLHNQNHVLSKITFSSTLKLDPSRMIHGFIFYDNNQRSTGEDKQQIIWGFDINWHFSPITSFKFDYQNSHLPEESYRDRNIFELQLRHQFSLMHQIAIHGRCMQMRFSDKNDMGFKVDYTYNLGIPLRRKKGISAVTGRIIDLQQNQPLRDIILRMNGMTAVSNNDGSFEFPALTPGDYILSIDREGLQSKHIATIQLPREVKIIENEDQEFSIEMTLASALSGEVVLEQVNDSNSETQYIIGEGDEDIQTRFSDVLVELKKDHEVVRRISDQNGDFKFPKLRPGKWKAKIHAYSLPKYHHLRQDTMTVILDPDSSKNIEIKVYQKKRKIRFMQDGGSL